MPCGLSAAATESIGPAPSWSKSIAFWTQPLTRLKDVTKPPVDQLIIHTVRGSTIESLGDGWYCASDADHHCCRVEGLWEAQTMVREAEVHNRPLT